MPYPSKGAWRFRNQTQGFDFWPTLESIQVVDAHPYDTATLSFEVVDETDTLVFQPEDRIWVTFAGVRIFAGHIKGRTRKQLSEMGVRVYGIECQDYTAKLDDSVITRRRDRGAESIRSRLRWIYTHVNFGIELDISGVPTGEQTPAANYHGMTTLEAFEQLADEENLFMQMDFDEDADGVPVLSFFRTITDVATFDLDDDAPDYADTFPYQEFQDTDDSSQLATMVYVIPENEDEAVWVVDQAQRDEYGWQQSSVSDSSVRGRRGARRIGGRFLDEFDQPLTEGSCVVWEPGLRSGQRINIKNATWGLDYVRYITEVTTSAVDPHDDSGEAYLRAEVRFSDRRKTRRRPGRPARGDTAVPTEQPVIDWTEDVVLPSIAPGSSLGGWGQQYRLRWGQYPFLHEGGGGPGSPTPVYLEPGPTWGPEWQALALPYYTKSVQSMDGAGNVSHPFSPAAWECGLGLGSTGGWRESEWWTSLQASLPSAPSDAAGILVDITLDVPGGPGVTGGIVYVRSSAPTAGRSGTPVASIPMGTTTVLIPLAAVTPGGPLWLGVGPAWQADYRYVTAEHGLGDEGACVGGYTSRSGWLRVALATDPTWAIYAAPAGDLGNTVPLGEDGTPWEGDNPIVIGTIEGAPDVSVSDGGLHVSDGGFSVVVQGAGEDEDQPPGPWSDQAGWSVTFPFEVDVLGDPAAIVVSTTRPGTETVGTISLDTTPSLAVSTSAGTDAVAVAIGAGERWMARFDDRSGWFRAKVWLASEGEPAEWLVEVPSPESDETTGDRVVITLRAASSQTVSMYQVAATPPAASGTWVRERVGISSGATDRVVTSQIHVLGSLYFDVGGSFVPASREDGVAGWLDYTPTAGMVIWANYIAA